MSTNDVKLFILADNRVRKRELISTWGLSILVCVEGKTILFDTTSDWNIVKYNAQVINAPLDSVEYIIISHWHEDHAGGLTGAIDYYGNLSKKITIIVPTKREFPLIINTNIIVGDKPVKISNKVSTTGALGRNIKEQALIISVEGKGPLVLVGCSHPGIDPILKRVCQLLNTNDVFGLIGGYHINNFKVHEVLSTLRKYNVKIIGPAHCTSDEAIEILQHKHKGDFINVYTGLYVEL